MIEGKNNNKSQLDMMLNYIFKKFQHYDVE